ncbi:kinase-like protein [Paxillus ammoniavirescens]|nr:kinase-like protein [Paxillus ammoniavirescens]
MYQGMLGSRMVAVKVLKPENFDAFNESLYKEAIVWRHLHHPNCLPFYGVCSIPRGMFNDTALVSPWVHQGDLHKYLACNPTANRTMLTLDIIRGLSYLHSMQSHVAHGNLTPDNILITEQGRACLAYVVQSDTQLRTRNGQHVLGGRIRIYTAPELREATATTHHMNKQACDMYALGGIIFVAYAVIKDEQPDFPKDAISSDMWSFVENLRSPNPSERLTAKKALTWMEQKAAGEGIDTSPPTFDKEWEWKPCNDHGGPFCVSLD